MGDGWRVHFSHTMDFTPVCTTELGAASRLMGAFAERNCEIIGLSVDAPRATLSKEDAAARVPAGWQELKPYPRVVGQP